jgi:anti-sigma B factor antagonist
VGEPLEVRIEAEPGLVTVVAVGEVDLATADDLLAALCGVVDAKPAVVAVDLAGVEFFGSDGVRCLVSASQYAAAAPDSAVELRVVRPSEPVRRVLELTALDTVLTVVDS